MAYQIAHGDSGALVRTQLNLLLFSSEPTYQPVTALEAETGYTITRTSADILVELIEEPTASATYALPTGVVGDRVRLRRSVVGGFDWTRTGGDAEDVLRVIEDEIEYQCTTAPSTWARLIRRHGAAVTTLTETSGAVDLVLVPDKNNYFLNAVSLAGELVWNLPEANKWIGTEVTAVRTGGGEFDLVLVGSPLRLRKGQVGIVVSDGLSWNPVEDRLDWLQVRETSSIINLSYDTHSGKIVRATANTNTTVKLNDTVPTQSTFRVMSHAGPARTMTFQPADTTDGDGTMINGTLGGSVVFSIPLNTPMMFLAYAELNSGGTLAQYIVMAFGAGTGTGGATEAVALGNFGAALTAIPIINWEGVYDAYTQGGTVSPSLNVAGSTINGGTVLIPWTGNGSLITWNANLVDFKTKLNADIRTSWTGLRMVLIRFDETAGRGEVIFADTELQDIIEVAPAAVTGPTGAALSLNYALGSVRRITTGAGNITSVAVTNWPASGQVGRLTLIITQGATARTIAWGGAYRFVGGTDLTLTATPGAIDIFTLMTVDGGTTIFAIEGGKGFAV